MRVAHLTTVDMSLRFLVLPQLRVGCRPGRRGVSGSRREGPFVDEIVRRGCPIHPSGGVDSRVEPRRRPACRAGVVGHPPRRSVPTSSTPTTPSRGSTGGSSAGSPGFRWWSTPSTASTPPRTTGRPSVSACTCSRPSPRAAPTPSWSRTPRTWSCSPVAHLCPGQDQPSRQRRRPGAVRPRAVRSRGAGADRAELGARPDDVVVGVVGRLVAEKGYPELFAAAEGVGRRATWCSPSGRTSPTSPMRCPREMVVGRRVDRGAFLGMRDDVDRLYAAMDIFVLPSHREGFPARPWRRRRWGSLSWPPTSGGAAQVVADGETGLLSSRCEDPAALRAAITAIGENARPPARDGGEGAPQGRGRVRRAEAS